MFEKVKAFFNDGAPWGEPMFRRHATRRFNVMKCTVKITIFEDTLEIDGLRGRAEKVYERSVTGNTNDEFYVLAEDKAKEIIQKYMKMGMFEIETHRYVPRERIKEVEICDLVDHFVEE